MPQALLKPFLALAFAISACSSSERPKSLYATKADAVAAGALERGWIPTLVPESARDIVEQHDIDTNEVWLTFSFHNRDRGALSSKCRQEAPRADRFPRKIDWWPAALTHGAHVENATVFACMGDTGQAYLAIEQGRDVAWFWTVP